MKDRNDHALTIGDTVYVYTDEDRGVEFQGVFIGMRNDFLLVEDQDGDTFCLPPQIVEIFEPAQDSNTVYNYLSPDEIPVSHDWFDTKEEAKEFLAQWVKSFERQGYYSSNEGRIELSLLPTFCELVTQPKEEEPDDEEVPQNYHFTCPECGNEWEEEWTCEAEDDCPECKHRHIGPDRVWIEEGKHDGYWHYYPEVHHLITVWGDVEPDVRGPYDSEDTVLAVAKRYRKENGDQHGLFWLDVYANSTPKIGTFTDAALNGDDNED